MVAAIDEDLRTIDEKTAEQQDSDLDGVRSAINEVTVEHVRVVG